MNKSHRVSKTKDRRLVDNLSAIAKQIKREYFYMSDKCLDAIISRVYKDVESVLVIDDAGLQVVRKLYDLGIKDVTLTFYTYDIKYIFDNFVYIINNIFRDLNVKLVSFEEAIKMKFDLIISNPPYGKIGAQITKKIIDDVDYKEFINLLPANDYKRVPELWQYQSDMEPCIDAFEDAAVTTHVAKLHKNKVNNITAFQFDISVHPTHYLDKYFILNNDKYHYALDEARHEQDLTISTKTTYCFGHRDLNHGYLPFKGLNYRYNFIEDINIDYMIKNSSNDNYYVKFKTALEKQNFRDFLKQTNTGYLFFKLMCFELNVDSKFSASVFPKVDWTRSWTVEEILKEYNYTDEEIKEVMEDLNNFKGMND